VTLPGIELRQLLKEPRNHAAKRYFFGWVSKLETIFGFRPSGKISLPFLELKLQQLSENGEPPHIVLGRHIRGLH